MSAVVTRNDPAGRWSFTEYRPEHLKRSVESIWHFSGLIPEPRERHVADGLVQIVILLDGAFQFESRAGRESCSSICFSGVQTGPTFIEGPRHRTSVLGIRLFAAGVYGVIGTPLHDTRDRLLDLEDLIGGAAAELADRCASGSTAEERVRRAAGWITERVARARGLDPLIAAAAARIERRHGLVAIRALETDTGLSKKRLITAFREQLGVTPKMYARIVRFRRATELLDTGRSPADVAAEAGYYDQPHMNLDFRELAGLPPLEFLATR